MDLDDEGMGVLADLHGDGDPEDERAREEFREIKESVVEERRMGDRSYKSMWKRYKGRVLLAVSAQAFAQLVRWPSTLSLQITDQKKGKLTMCERFFRVWG